MARYLTIRKFAQETGYTEDAVRSKIRDGIWKLGEVWFRAPDGRTLMDMQGYESWVEMGEESGQSRTRASRSRSCTAVLGVVNGSRSSPPPLT